MGNKGWAIVGFAAALVVGFFSWEWFLSPEARVTRTLNAVAVAAEEVDAPRFLSFLAEDYSDYIHADRAALEQRLATAFERVDRFNVTLQAIDVEVASDDATARFDLIVVAFQGDDRFIVVGTPLEGEKVQARFVREPEGWKIAAVERRGAGP